MKYIIVSDTLNCYVAHDGAVTTLTKQRSHATEYATKQEAHAVLEKEFPKSHHLFEVVKERSK